MITQSAYPSFAHSSHSTPSPRYFSHLVFSTTLLLPSTATHAIGIQNAAATSEKQKMLACRREIQVHKHWTKDPGLHKGMVYSQKGLTAMHLLMTETDCPEVTLSG